MHELNEENIWSERIIGAAIEVHRILGPGLLEGIYEDALCVVFEERAIPYERQVTLPVIFKGRTLRNQRLDLCVADLVVVETKAVANVPDIATSVLFSYLRFSGHQLGLIVNFHANKLVNGVTRVIRTRTTPEP